MNVISNNLIKSTLTNWANLRVHTLKGRRNYLKKSMLSLHYISSEISIIIIGFLSLTLGHFNNIPSYLISASLLRDSWFSTFVKRSFGYYSRVLGISVYPSFLKYPFKQTSKPFYTVLVHNNKRVGCWNLVKNISS